MKSKFDYPRVCVQFDGPKYEFSLKNNSLKF